MTSGECDWTGRPIPDDETDDTEITVWTLEPSGTTDYDTTIVRDYRDAIEAAQLLVETLMDDSEVSLPIVITIGRQKMTLGDYLEAVENEPW